MLAARTKMVTKTIDLDGSYINSVHTPCMQAAVLVCPSSLVYGVYAASGSGAKKAKQPLINVAINCGDMW